MIKKKTTNTKKTENMCDDFTADLIKQLNKENGEKIAFNLSTDDVPTNIKRWISTGSRQLDCIISNGKVGGFPEGRIVEIQGPTSCHAHGDKVLLSDGREISVENVKVGDKLLGPDGSSRKVLECHSGKDDMYNIIPKLGGKTYTVNKNHLLHLKRASGFSKNKNSPNSKENDVVNIPVKEYINKSKTFKKMYRQGKVAIENFCDRGHHQLPIPPYVLGLLLGDGYIKENRIELTTADDIIQNEFCNFIERSGFEYKIHKKKNNKAVGIYYKTNIASNQFLYEEQKIKDPIKNALRGLELLDSSSGTKFIPDMYKFSSLQDRLNLIAGLIDTDGHLNKSCFDFITKSPKLADDMSFICSSVGLRVTANDKVINFDGKNLLYKRLTISGATHVIPTKLKRKQASKNGRKEENVYLTGITVEPVGVGKFYGFSVDKDNLYLTDDFSVFHNSGKSHIAFEAAKATQKMGGIVVYIDTENATSLGNLKSIGIDVNKRFVFCQTACTEEIFAIAESTIMKARAMAKDVPVTIVWDSIAASSPKAELEGDYDQNTIGLQARVLGKGMRKIVNVIGNQNVLFLLINQQRQKIGVMYGDNCVDPNTTITVRRKVNG